MLRSMENIPGLVRRFPFLVMVGVFLVLGRGSSAAEVGNLAAVSFDSHVVVLAANGHLSAFDILGKPVDAAELKPLQLAGLMTISTGSGKLYGATATVLCEIDHWGGAWRKTATYAEHGDTVLRVAVVGKRPLLVYSSEVVDPVEPRAFAVPMSIGKQVHTQVLRLQAAYATPSMLWLGTGHGEWGGHLMGLNPRTGEWVQYYDALHYVTGITSADPGEVIVSWSMSHLSLASTLIRQHGATAQPDREFPELRDDYYQGIAYSSFDQTLYAVEQNWLVTVADGKPSRVLELTLRLYKAEPYAIGVAPGVIALLPVAEHQVVVVAGSGVPVLVDTAGKKAVPFGKSVE